MKIVNTSKKKQNPTKVDLTLGHSNGDSDEGLEIVGFRESTIGDRAIIEIGRKMIDWVKDNPKALKLSNYFHQQGISMRTANRWCNRIPLFGALYETAMNMIGDRREELALVRAIDCSMVMRTMHLYDFDYKKSLPWLESIKNNDIQNKQQIVIIDRYPSTDQVPPLKEEV